jgi:hypothetical protein
MMELNGVIMRGFEGVARKVVCKANVITANRNGRHRTLE